MNWLINLIKRHCKNTTIELDGDPYLTRYYIFHNQYIGLFLHHFHRADKDRDLHNHPWKWALSLILIGSYIEQRLTRNLEFKTYFPGDFNLIPGGCFHRIAQIHPGLHTLFLRGPRFKKWGFLRAKDGGVVFEEYKD